jgi:hypothetical protein
MNRTHEEILAERQRLKAEYGEIYDQVAALLFRHDPVGINYDFNTDEYEPEVRTILPRLKACRSADEVRVVVHEEFVRWFSADSAGSEQNYAVIATEIWQLLQKRNPT